MPVPRRSLPHLSPRFLMFEGAFTLGLSRQLPILLQSPGAKSCLWLECCPVTTKTVWTTGRRALALPYPSWAMPGFKRIRGRYSHGSCSSRLATTRYLIIAIPPRPSSQWTLKIETLLTPSIPSPFFVSPSHRNISCHQAIDYRLSLQPKQSNLSLIYEV